MGHRWTVYNPRDILKTQRDRRAANADPSGGGASEIQRSRREEPITKTVKGGKNMCKRISSEDEGKKVLGVQSCTGLSAY